MNYQALATRERENRRIRTGMGRPYAQQKRAVMVTVLGVASVMAYLSRPENGVLSPSALSRSLRYREPGTKGFTHHHSPNPNPNPMACRSTFNSEMGMGNEKSEFVAKGSTGLGAIGNGVGAVQRGGLSNGNDRGGGGIFKALAAAAGGLGILRALPANSMEEETKAKGPRKILILLSDTGGGHRASARALVDAFNVLRPGEVEAEVVDVWTEHAPRPFNNFVKNYQYLAQRPLQWRLLYGFGRWGPFRRASNEWSNMRCRKPFQTMMEESDPDLIVSVHPLCQFIPLRVMRKIARKTDKKVPFVTVVTDLNSAHPTWFHKDVDKCFVATPELAKMARYHGVREEKIRIHGLPIRPAFWSSV
eukprot:CAMPEP_0184478664 /NCGR_PEP_ID=MMETSP0113_2-20130426/634_1 /TAXON_ID=91329 /ORGANISM="Norrisiella sphaerica, Strain BC52" /LENGTH=361 /DNA_ID=CAMNT_0026856543 /DNA_START=115 /DNA_END=1196 /DNA_ORIENTATION=+